MEVASALATSLDATLDTAGLAQAAENIMKKCISSILLPQRKTPPQITAPVRKRNPMRQRSRSFPRCQASTLGTWHLAVKSKDTGSLPLPCLSVALRHHHLPVVLSRDQATVLQYPSPK